MPAGVESHTLLFCVWVVAVRKLGTIPKHPARRMDVKNTEKRNESYKY
jgi:hypothetical protein